MGTLLHRYFARSTLFGPLANVQRSAQVRLDVLRVQARVKADRSIEQGDREASESFYNRSTEPRGQGEGTGTTSQAASFSSPSDGLLHKLEVELPRLMARTAQMTNDIEGKIKSEDPPSQAP